jgi:DNA (cytosine-5)-methyltransferase 1
MEKLKVLDLFSGIGGFSLGLERTGGFETVGFCEIEPFCQQVLRKHWPDVPIYEDVRNLDHEGPIDVITGGYPCQPFSLAGQRKGEADDRHLWPAMFACIKEHRPAWVIAENVTGHLSMGLDDVLSDLESEGYACRAFIIPACALGAAHRRDRIWIVAYAKGVGMEGRWAVGKQKSQAHARPKIPQRDGTGRRENEWQIKPRMGRTPHGVSDWLDGTWEYGIARTTTITKNRAKRLKTLGNAVVPQIPEMIGNAILKAERQYND